MIVLYWKDLILKSRIKEHALAKGQELTFVRSPGDLKTMLENVKPTRFIADLSGGVALATDFQGLLPAELESIGVIAHVDKDVESAALSAGFSRVIPRSMLVKTLDQLLTS